MNATAAAFSDQLLSALFNGAYQGLLVTGAIALLLRLVPRTNAATRYAALSATFLVVAGLPVLQLLPRPAALARVLSGVELLAAASRGDENVAAVAPMGWTTAPTKTGSQGALEAGEAADPPGLIGISRTYAGTPPAAANAAKVSASRSQPPSFGGEAFEMEARDMPLADSTSPYPKAMVSGLSGGPATIHFWPAIASDWRISLPKAATVLVVGLWVVLAAIRLAGLARQYGLLHRLKGCAEDAPDGVATLFEQLKADLAIRRPARPRLSKTIATPVVLGFRQPVVLLPAGMPTEIAGEQLAHILRHELAHVRRYDDWGNLCQQLVKAVFFFNPAICWLAHRLTIEREIACDDQVLADSRNPRAYARFLTEFASRTHDRLRLAAAPAAWSNKNQLRERISMILNANRNSSPRLGRTSAGVLTIAATLVAIVALYAAPRLALAQETKDAPPTAPTPPAAVTPVAVPEAPAQPVQPRAVSVAPVAPVRAVIPPAAVAMVGVSTPTDLAVSLGDPEDDVPAPPRAGARLKGKSSDSLEARVERLERLVKELLAREQRKPTADLRLRVPKSASVEGLLQNKADQFNDLINKEALARIKEQVKIAAENAAQQAKRAAEDVKRATRDAERMARRSEEQARASAFGVEGRSFESMKRQLEVQRQSLERQLKSVAERLDRLQRDQERIKSDQQRKQDDALKRDLERRDREHIAPPEPTPDEGSDSVKKRRES